MFFGPWQLVDMDLTSSSHTKGNGFSLVEKVKLSFLKMKREDECCRGEPAKSGINSPEEQKWKRRGRPCVRHATAACGSRLVWIKAGVDPEFFRPSTPSRLINFLLISSLFLIN